MARLLTVWGSSMNEGAASCSLPAEALESEGNRSMSLERSSHTMPRRAAPADCTAPARLAAGVDAVRHGDLL